MVGSFYVVFAVITRVIFDEDDDDYNEGEITIMLYRPADVIINIYILMLAMIFIMGFGVKPRYSEAMYKVASGIFSIFMLATVAFMIYYCIDGTEDYLLLYGFLTSALVFTVAILLHGCSLYVLTGVF